MLAPSSLLKGIVSRFLPTPFADDRDSDKPIRLFRYGEQFPMGLPSNLYGYCDEGSMLLATNPTISTGQTQVAAQTAFSDTTPSLYIYNPESSANPAARSIYMGYLKMIATAAATAATAIHYAFILDTVARALTTDNTLAITCVNPSGNSAPVIAPTFKWQNSATASVIAASSTAKRIVARGVLGGLNVAGDVMAILFGQLEGGAHAGLTAAQAAALSRRVDCSPPIIVGPGQSLTGHFWAPSSSASWNPEFECVMWAR